MMKLLRAGYRRYFRSILFWISVAASMILGLTSGITVREERMFNDIYTVFSFAIFAVLISLMIGREFSDGGFRNKTIVGHTKIKLFISEYLLAISICLILTLISATVFSLLNISIFGRFIGEFLIRSIVGVFLFAVSIITFIAIVSMLITKKAIAAVILLLVIFVSFFAADEINLNLNFPEYNKRIEVKYDGTPVITEEWEKNPAYVDSPQREVYTFILNTLPIGQSIQYAEMSTPMFSEQNVMLSIPEEDERLLETLPLYSLGNIFFLLAVGYCAFRKKDFK